MVSAIGKKLRIGFTLSIFSMCLAIGIGIIAMGNVLSNLKFSTQEQLGAAISTMDIRVNQLERNLALKKLILLGEDKEYFQKQDSIFNERHKKMYQSIKAAAEPLTSKAIQDEIRENFIAFYNEIQEFDKARNVKRIYQNKGEEAAIKEVREDRDKAGTLMNSIVDELKREATLHSEKYQVKAIKLSLLIQIITLIAFIFAVIMAIITIKGITKSITIIHHTAARIYGGELELEINIDSHDEFKDLAEAFNRMRKSLLSAQKILDRKRQPR